MEEEFIGSITAWKVTEALKSVGSVVKTVVEVPANLVTDAVRPDYWVPDVDIIGTSWMLYNYVHISGPQMLVL